MILFTPTFLTASTPTAPATGMSAWYRSDNATVLAGFVTNWLDKSGNTYDQTPGLHPSYNTTDSNWSGLPSVQFDGLTQYLTSAVASSNIIQGNNFDIFVVCRPTNAGTGTDTTRNMTGVLTEQSGNWGCGFGSTKAGVQENGGGGTHAEQTFSVNTKHNLEFRIDGGNLIASVSGQTDVSVAAGTIGNLTGVFGIGQNIPFGIFFQGTIVEIIVYNAALSAGNRSLTRSYLTGRYGITW